MVLDMKIKCPTSSRARPWNCEPNRGLVWWVHVGELRSAQRHMPRRSPQCQKRRGHKMRDLAFGCPINLGAHIVNPTEYHEIMRTSQFMCIIFYDLGWW
jgi:hypothetical protein